jgi:Uma2 family endonuclease
MATNLLPLRLRPSSAPAPVRVLPRWELDEAAQRVADNLVIETEEPVESDYQGRAQRALIEPLVASWKPAVDFWAASDVGVWIDPHMDCLVPDVFVALGVPKPADPAVSSAYFYWKTKKPPTVVIEIVSNREGGEMGSKFERYASWGIPHYVVFDPFLRLRGATLRMFTLHGGRYRPVKGFLLRRLGLGLRVWSGEFEGAPAPYLRWCDQHGVLLPSKEDITEAERQRADGETERAEAEKRRADSAEHRAALLEARLRALGVEP